MERRTQGPVISRATLLKGLGGVALAPVLGSSLASCSSDSGASGGSATSGSLVFTFYGDAEVQRTYGKLFQKFTEKYPDIKLKFQAIASDSWADFINTVSTRLAGGQQIDVLQVATEGQRLLAAKNLLEPLEPHMAKDQAVVDEFYKDTPPEIVKWLNTFGSPDGKTYYMPFAYNTMAMYVNTQVFKQAGVELPAEEWTWEDFRAAGQQMKRKTGAFIGAVGSGYFVDVMPWLVTNGASTMDPDWTKATFDSPQAVEALTFVRSLVVDGLVPKPGGTFDAPTQMSRGKLATFGGGRWPNREVQKLKMADRVRLNRWPNNGKVTTVVGWEGIPILRSSKNKEAAWTFIKYTMSQEFGNVLMAGGALSVPARISLATGDEFAKNSPANTTLLYEQVKDAVPVPAPQRSTEFQKLIEEAWLQGISGTKDPQKALSEANAKMQGLLS